VIPLEHIVEPSELLLTWQPADESAPNRTRRIVARIVKHGNDGATLRYLKESDDFQEALAAGFVGFPAFPIEHGVASHGVVEAMMRRLPPRSRADFDRYLEQHRLPAPFMHSDFALLGYTGARLPSDGFGLVPVFPPEAVPCDLVVEIAGLRHVYRGDVSSIRPGDAINVRAVTRNPVDQDAVGFYWNGVLLGYVNRAIRGTFSAWLNRFSVHATVDRVNGKPDRPLVYVRVEVR
jgi:hypothetical protein